MLAAAQSSPADAPSLFSCPHPVQDDWTIHMAALRPDDYGIVLHHDLQEVLEGGGGGWPGGGGVAPVEDWQPEMVVWQELVVSARPCLRLAPPPMPAVAGRMAALQTPLPTPSPCSLSLFPGPPPSLQLTKLRLIPPAGEAGAEPPAGAGAGGAPVAV